MQSISLVAILDICVRIGTCILPMPTAWGILLPALTGGGSGSIVSDHFLTVTTLKYLPLIFFIFVGAGAVKEITLYRGGAASPYPLQGPERYGPCTASV